MPLTDIKCRNAVCPPDKARVRLTDSGGLYLEISPNKSKRWFWKYLFDGKEKRIALGHYAEVGSPAVRVNLKSAPLPRQCSRSPRQRRGARLIWPIHQNAVSQPDLCAGSQPPTGAAGVLCNP
jgi:hypothetical protein